MARLVEIIGVTHNPFLPKQFQDDPNVEPGVAQALENFTLMRKKLSDARPDVLIMVGCDHLNQFFMDNMPAFIVGKAPSTHGPFPEEERDFKLSEYRAAVHVEMAKTLVREGFREGVDFAFTDELRIDHSFTVPLSFLRPEMDLPIVPVSTNVIAPPIAPAQRFHDVGVAIADIVERLPSEQRVAVLASGHVSFDVGGPKLRGGSTDPEFDRRMLAMIAEADIATLVREATWERLVQVGNATPGFMNYVLLLGVARDQRPSFIDYNPSRRYAGSPFMSWEPEQERR